VSHRALLTVFALTLLDLALWHWSLDANRGALALVSGLTLPPLFCALLWLGAVNLARLLARGARKPAARLKTQTARAAHRRPRTRKRAIAVAPSAAATTRRSGKRRREKSTREKIAA
jgi:hypothetical protein